MPHNHATPELVARIAARDEKALLLLHDLMGPPLRGMLARILNSAEEIEDVLETALAEMWKQSNHQRALKGSPEAWLTLTARNIAVSRLRAARTATNTTRRKSPALSLREEWLPSPREFALLSDRQELMKNAIRQLPAAQRKVLDLAIFQGYTEEEIATVLKKPLGRVQDELRAALLYVRQRLHTLMGTWTAGL